MNIADKLTTVAENQQKVFDAGRTKEWSDFWDSFQDNGNLTDYSHAFRGNAWCSDNFYPEHDITVIQGDYAFYQMRREGDSLSLIDRLNELNVKLDLSQATSIKGMFSYNYVFTDIPTIDMTNLSGTNNDNLFSMSKNIRKIEKIKTHENVATYANWFLQNYALEEIEFEGTIAANIDFKVCPLTHDSLMSIINALKNCAETDKDGAYTLTLGSANQNKLTQDELQIITDKGWLYA